MLLSLIFLLLKSRVCQPCKHMCSVGRDWLDFMTKIFCSVDIFNVYSLPISTVYLVFCPYAYLCIVQSLSIMSGRDCSIFILLSACALIRTLSHFHSGFSAVPLLADRVITAKNIVLETLHCLSKPFLLPVNTVLNHKYHILSICSKDTVYLMKQIRYYK